MSAIELMQRLHQKGFISGPMGKAKSVLLTEKGALESARLLDRSADHPDGRAGND
jgi:hypothetical protein